MRHLKWLTEVTGTKIGTWPIYELPMKFSETPAYIGGPVNRGAPGYGGWGSGWGVQPGYGWGGPGFGTWGSGFGFRPGFGVGAPGFGWHRGWF